MNMGIKPGDAVLLIERRRDQQIVYNALVVGMSMRETLIGTRGEMAVEVAFVSGSLAMCDPVTRMGDVVHISHRDWLEGRAALAYEEMLPPRGVCRFCHCTERRACAGGCSWADKENTICNSNACLSKYDEWAQAKRTEFERRA